jgi:dGTPase
LINSLLTKYNGNASNYDALILKLLPEKHHYEKADLYERLLHICHFVSLLTDGMLLEFETINGKKRIN